MVWFDLDHLIRIIKSGLHYDIVKQEETGVAVGENIKGFNYLRISEEDSEVENFSSI